MSDDERPSAGKRLRISRACNSCRRKKAKCDGRQPCQACRANGSRCEYAAASRMSSSDYISTLETKVSELEKLLYSSTHHDEGGTTSENSWMNDQSGASSQHPIDHDMMESIVNDSQDESDKKNVRAKFGGFSLLDRLHNLCSTISRRQNKSDQQDTLEDDNFSAAFDLAPPEIKPSISWEIYSSLPSRDSIRTAVNRVMTTSCCTLRFLDEPEIYRITDDVLKTAEEGNEDPSHQQMCLIFSVLALARRCERSSTTDKHNTDSDTAHSIRYFRASRALLDPANCQDLVSLEALICMAIYTQSCSMMSTSHSYICMAIAAALHLGIFDEDAGAQQTNGGGHDSHRNAIAAVLFTLDTYITTALGLPRMLRDVRLACFLPESTHSNDPRDPLYGTFCGAHLANILSEILESVYPAPRRKASVNGVYGIKKSDVERVQKQLTWWFRQLDDTASSPSKESSADDRTFLSLRSQLLLRLYHSHVEIVLYRPFIHHALRNQVDGDDNVIKAHECGSACIKASMQVVWLVEKMEECELFNPAYWLVTWVVAFAATCLVLYVKGAQEGLDTTTERQAVTRLKDFCDRFSSRSSSLRRCHAFLQARFTNDHEEASAQYPDIFDISSNFDQDLYRFQQAVEQQQNSHVAMSEGQEDMIAAMLFPNLHTFVTRSL